MDASLNNVFDPSANQDMSYDKNISPKLIEELQNQAEVLDNIINVLKYINVNDTSDISYISAASCCCTASSYDRYVEPIRYLHDIDSSGFLERKKENEKINLVNQKVYPVDNNGKIKK
jgi:hypothetical protein